MIAILQGGPLHNEFKTVTGEAVQKFYIPAEEANAIYVRSIETDQYMYIDCCAMTFSGWEEYSPEDVGSTSDGN